MDDVLASQIIDAVDEFRATMFSTYCETAEDPTEAVIQLVSQFVAQAGICLGAVYNGNKAIVQKHLILLVVHSLTDEDELLKEPASE